MSPTMTCASCAEGITEKYLRFDGNVYHPQCLTCQDCGVPVQRVHKKHGKRLCDQCALDACSQCARPMKDGGGIFNGQHWCNECFVCHGCRAPLDVAFTSRDNPGKIFCRDCLSHHCHSCKKAIRRKSMTFEGNHFCLECFVCTECGLAFQDGQVFKKDGGRLCGRCVHGLPGAVKEQQPAQAPSTTSRRRLAVKAAKDPDTVWQWQGGYIERGRHCGKPLFVRDGADSGTEYFLYYHPSFARWFIGKKICTESSVNFSCQSLDDGVSPELCTWEPDSVQEIVEKTKRAAWDEKDKSLFCDKAFPHRLIPSIDGPGAEPTGLSQHIWVPARRLHRGQWRLFDGIDPQDLLQGKVGNCWLMAALAALAEYPKAVEKVFKVDGSQTDGRFVLELFDYRVGQMVDIVVDEYIPCAPAYWWADDAEPYFSRPNGNEMWCLILEKGLAKLFGSYAHLAEGQPSSCFRAVTGCTKQELWNRSGCTWERSTMCPDHLNRFRYDQLNRHAVGSGEFWELLCKHNLESHLMSVIIDGTEQIRTDGLVEGHAYSLLFALEVPTLRGTMRMLMLRNPWGGDKEWNGRWSDNHPLWTQHQEVRSKLRPQFGNDGVFWMQWEDFQAIFDSAHICLKPMLEGDALDRFRSGLKDFSHFDPSRGSRARGLAAKAKVLALAKMGLLRQRMAAKEAVNPVEGTQSTGTQCFSFRAAPERANSKEEVESRPVDAAEGSSSLGTQFFSLSAGEKAALRTRERAAAGANGDEGCGTASSGPQFFSLKEHDKELGRLTLLSQSAEGADASKAAEGTQSAGPQCFSFSEKDKAMWRTSLAHGTSM